MSFKVEDHYDLRKHLHVDHNMIFYEEQKKAGANRVQDRDEMRKHLQVDHNTIFL